MDEVKESRNELIKRKTLELYDMLPQPAEERKRRHDIRDQIIELNYAFFGYVASKTFINNTSITYEDKVQSALMHFCECWWWYKWKGDEKHKGYRQDLSFTVFFKPRIGEMIERELNEVKYSIRRSLCMEAGEQVGKHWGQVKYDDLKEIDLPPEKMNSLKAIFGTLYIADLETHEMFIEDSNSFVSEFENMSDKYDSIEELLIYEMVEQEGPITDKQFSQMSDIYGIDEFTLREKYPKALDILFKRLQDSQDIRDAF